MISIFIFIKKLCIMHVLKIFFNEIIWLQFIKEMYSIWMASIKYILKIIILNNIIIIIFFVYTMFVLEYYFNNNNKKKYIYMPCESIHTPSFGSRFMLLPFVKLL